MISNPLRAFLALLAWHGAFRTSPRQVLGFRKARRYEKPGLYPIFAITGADERGDKILEELRGKSADDLTDTSGLPDELRGKTADELVQFVEVLDAHLRSLHEDETTRALRDKTDVEQKAFDYGLKLRDLAIKRIDEHRAVQEVFSRRPKAVEAAMFRTTTGKDDPFGDVRRLSVAEARDLALRSVDDRTATMHLDDDQKAHVERQIRKDSDIARRILVTETDDYRSAWVKLVTQPQPILTNDEQRAVLAFNEYRAMSEGSTSAGGFGVPVYIDPSIIMTAQGSGNPFLQIAAQKTITTNAWKGVSSAGVSWSFDTEGSAVSDDSPTLAQPNVPVFMARGFIPYSIEVGQDYPGFADEMATLLGEGYNELLIDKFSRGSGTGEPLGVITALDADTTAEVRLATAGTFAASDFYNVWAQLPQRFRNKASWMMSVGVNNSIRQFGTANNFHATTIQLAGEWVERLMNRQVYESPYFPGALSTASTANVLVVGDFSNYIVARRAGMNVELVPTLFDVTNNRPTGQRGWFAWARVGGGTATNAAFKLLNQT